MKSQGDSLRPKNFDDISLKETLVKIFQVSTNLTEIILNFIHCISVKIQEILKITG